MIEIRINNKKEEELYHIIDLHNGHKLLTIRTDNIEKCMRYFRDNKDIDGVYICPLLGYKHTDISFLQQYKYIKSISISDGEKIDLSGIENLNELEYISIAGNIQPIDYSLFPNLEYIRSDWHSNVTISEKCRRLKHICLWHYKSQSRDLTAFTYLPNLESFGMIQSAIESTKGISKFKKLKKINLAYLPKLTTLCGIENLPIEISEVQNCKRLKNLDHFRHTKSLRKLICIKCGAIQSINFIRELKYLDHFTFF